MIDIMQTTLILINIKEISKKDTHIKFISIMEIFFSHCMHNCSKITSSRITICIRQNFQGALNQRETENMGNCLAKSSINEMPNGVRELRRVHSGMKDSPERQNPTTIVKYVVVIIYF